MIFIGLNWDSLHVLYYFAVIVHLFNKGLISGDCLLSRNFYLNSRPGNKDLKKHTWVITTANH